jgi:2-succinyl-5-enolpyruvyl-6-hydroxy-3-cyclohexene-1-carboxylate synthase
MNSAVAQTLWARTIVRALADAGVTTAVVSPGSRSTPITAALADPASPLAVYVAIDERAAGFFALGLARASGAPVALVCTSGSAPAHYYPAVIEAAMAEVPLVVISADRPPEMHGGGAAQTIDQTRLYGAHARTFVDLGPPAGDELALRATRRRVIQTVLAARAPRPGPVQIDVPLRKPLEPALPVAPDEIALAARLDALSTRVAPPRPPLADDGAVAALAAALAASRRPFVVAGPRGLDPGRDATVAAALSRLARRRGAAVLAETTSQLRGALDPEVTRLDRFDLVLAAGVPLRPDLILQLGAEPVAAAWPGFLAAHPEVPRWVVAEHPWPDPHSSAAGVVLGDVADALDRAAAATPAHADAEWLREVATAERRAAAIADALARDGEPAAIRAALDGAGDALVVLGNSLPVRVVDHVWTGRREIVSQRGASGIDGLVAGAAGAAAAGRPVVVVLGDVSFAHDVGSLALLRKADVIVVVIDNRGGRIFEALPVAEAIAGDDFARLWLTAPDLDVVAIARGFGLTAETVRSPDALRAAVAARKTTVLHVPVAPSSARTFRDAAVARLRGTP